LGFNLVLAFIFRTGCCIAALLARGIASGVNAKCKGVKESNLGTGGVAAQTGVRVLWSDGVVHPGLLEGVC
jgi:hypothetical protein